MSLSHLSAVKRRLKGNKIAGGKEETQKGESSMSSKRMELHKGELTKFQLK